MPEFARATRGRWTAGLTLCVACSPALAAGQCKLAKLPEFPVTMNQLSPEIVAKINGTDVRLIVDSGAFFSMIDYGSAVALRLRVRAAPVGFYSEAIGGRVTLSIASVNDFMLPGFTLHDVEKATEQYDLWITSHPEDARLPAALNGLCRARAFGDVELQRALVDCNAALKHAAKGSPFYAEVMGARGFVFLRMGDYDKSIADFDASLKVIPKDASFLYCRGIDKLWKQKTSEGQADIAQARAISSEVADNFSRYGISP
jgi:hypothetical protein